MGYTDTLLAQGEVIARRGRQHWLALILDSRAALGVWTVALLLLVATVVFNFNPDIRNIVGIIILVLVLIGLVIFAYRWLRWANQDYVVTNRRVLKVEGIVNKRSADSSLEKINDLVLEENLLGRILNYGDLDIITAAEISVDRFRMLDHAKEWKRVMLDEKHRLETGEDSRMPSPPLMASSRDSVAPSTVYTAAPSSTTSSAEGTSTAPSYASPAPDTAAQANPANAPADPVTVDPDAAATATEQSWSSAPAPTSAPPPTGASAQTREPDDARDVTQTLARLADLRDRGAITPEEYEAKKTELLSRL